MDTNGGVQPSDGSLTSGKRASSPGPVPTPAEAGSSEAKRPRLDGVVPPKHPEDARLASIRSDAGSEPASPSNSRQSSPASASRQSPIIAPSPVSAGAGGGFGGAKRRGANDERKALPRNVDRVYYGEYDIKTWYHSPYPLDDDHGHAAAAAAGGANGGAGPSVQRTPSTSKLKIKIRNSSSGGQAASKTANGSSATTPATSGPAVTAPSTATPAENLDATAMPPPAVTTKAPTAGPSAPSNTTTSDPSPAAKLSTPATTTTSSAPGTPSGSAPLTSPLEAKPRVSHLWICEGCFKYMRTHAAYYAHKVQQCKHRHPPGRKVYQRGSHIIWEVDGAKEKLYAQNLSLFGKLFIDHKTIFFDVEPFLFYIVTDAAAASFDYVLGFFSKEKVSYDDYNLACIITFPPFQKKGFGTLMIEYSYHLSAKAGIVGGPERPLSELGFKGYLSYWSAVVLRTLALALDDDDADVAARLLPMSSYATSGSSPSKAGALAAAAAAGAGAGAGESHGSSKEQKKAGAGESHGSSKEQKKAAARVRASLLFGTSPIVPTSPPKKAVIKDNVEAAPAAPSVLDGADLETLATTLHEKGELTADELAEVRKAGNSKSDLPAKLVVKLEAAHGAAKTTVDGGKSSIDASATQDAEPSTPSSTSTPTTSRIKLDRAARHLTPLRPSDKPSTTTTPAAAVAPSTPSAAAKIPTDLACIATTLERLSVAANLRVEDTAFALAECGLLKTRLKALPAAEAGGAAEEKDGPMMVADVAAQAAAAAVVGQVEVGKEAQPVAPSSQLVILVTREAVRKAMKERGIKRPVLETQYVFA